MKYLFYDKELPYLGKELAPHFILNKFNIMGDAIVSFVGEANVSLDHMVDLEDVIKKEHIYSPKMLHFLMESWSFSMIETVALQRLLVASTKELLEEKYSVVTTRDGDDLYFDGDRKMSVSIATRSTLSTLIHYGINVETKGTPVKTAGLSEFNIDPREFATKLATKFIDEIESMKLAVAKVRSV